MENFFEYCKQFIQDHLPNMQGNSYYGADLSGYLTEGINADGTATYSRDKAIEYIKEWWYDCDAFSEYEKLNFGERSNPFENTEAFMVRMVIEGCYAMLAKCELVDKNWNDKFKLTKQAVKTILEQLDELDEDMEIF